MVSQLPSPPLEDPLTSPPRDPTGVPWGERGGSTGDEGSRVWRGLEAHADAVTGPLAHRLRRRRPPSVEDRRHRDRRATQDDARHRMARRSGQTEHVDEFQRAGIGPGGARMMICPMHSNRSGAKRRARCARQSVRQACSFTHRVNEKCSRTLARERAVSAPCRCALPPAPSHQRFVSHRCSLNAVESFAELISIDHRAGQQLQAVPADSACPSRRP